MEYIDLDNWKRKEHYNFFHNMDYPQYNICFNVDITNFMNFVRKNKISFYYSMIYVSTKVACEIEDLRYRIRDNKVVLHEKLHPSFTDINSEEDDLFKFVTVDMKEDIFEFVTYCEEKSRNQREYFNFNESERRDDLLYITSIPWISFTHLSHTISFNKDDSVPRISWGKYFSEQDKILLPFSVQVNHALIDGIHIGRYLTKLQNYIDSL